MKKLIVISIIAALLGLSSAAYANNVAVSSVSLVNKDTGAGTVEIQFNLAQDNVFAGKDANNAEFYDRIWIFVKWCIAGDLSLETNGWSHATLMSGGTLTPTADGLGAYAQVGDLQRVKWNYAADGVTLDQITTPGAVKVRVMAIEMVYIPTGSFIYNESNRGGTGTGNIAGPATIGDANTLPPLVADPGWPNGYSAFYMMKYEVSQGQYADFLNMSPPPRATADPSGTALGPYWAVSPATSGGTWQDNCALTYTSGNAYGSRYALNPASAANRAMGYIAWDDFKTYASWCGLRPPTEMEFEKAARGGGTTAKIYPWGNTAPTTGNSTYIFDGGLMYKYYGYFIQAYTVLGTGYANPITDVGHFLSGDIVRTNEQTGVSVYGVTDLVSNTQEAVINCAWPTKPTNGDGTITPPVSWPTGSSGRGYRAVSGYDSGSDSAYISSRGWIVATSGARSGSAGARFVRTAE